MSAERSSFSGPLARGQLGGLVVLMKKQKTPKLFHFFNNKLFVQPSTTLKHFSLLLDYVHTLNHAYDTSTAQLPYLLCWERSLKHISVPILNLMFRNSNDKVGHMLGISE